MKKIEITLSLRCVAGHCGGSTVEISGDSRGECFEVANELGWVTYDLVDIAICPECLEYVSFEVDADGYLERLVDGCLYFCPRCASDERERGEGRGAMYTSASRCVYPHRFLSAVCHDGEVLAMKSECMRCGEPCDIYTGRWRANIRLSKYIVKCGRCEKMSKTTVVALADHDGRWTCVCSHRNQVDWRLE